MFGFCDRIATAQKSLASGVIKRLTAAMSHRALPAVLPALAAACSLAAAPLLPAASQQPAMVPFNPNSAAVRSDLQAVQIDSVEQFDPVARAEALSRELPRRWRGAYQAYGSGSPLSVQLELASLEAVGQMLVLRGTMTVGTVSTPVQGNLNAKSDQLDLLILGDASSVGLEAGGLFQGLQTFQLSGWVAPRLTTSGGKLELTAVGSRS